MRSSGRRYASASGHGLLIGVMTRQVINIVIFCKSCKLCEERLRKQKKKEGMENTIELDDDDDDDMIDMTAAFESDLATELWNGR